MDGFVVKENAVRILSVRAQTLSVGRRNYDQGVVIERLAPQKSDQFPDRGIRSRNPAIV